MTTTNATKNYFRKTLLALMTLDDNAKRVKSP